MMRIDYEKLPPSTSTEQKEGLYAEFHPDGSLAHFGNYRDGQLCGWALYLDNSGFSGRIHKEQTILYPDADEAASEAGFAEWAERWIGEIAADARSDRRCSFCGKGDEEVRRLIAGPTTYICDECVDICSAILRDIQERERANPPS
jgi:hypothetical protein